MTDTFRLALEEDEPVRRLTGPEELTYAKNFEVACHNYAFEDLEQLLKTENVNAAILESRMQRTSLRQMVLRRMVAERKV